MSKEEPVNQRDKSPLRNELKKAEEQFLQNNSSTEQAVIETDSGFHIIYRNDPDDFMSGFIAAVHIALRNFLSESHIKVERTEIKRRYGDLTPGLAAEEFSRQVDNEIFPSFGESFAPYLRRELEDINGLMEKERDPD